MYAIHYTGDGAGRGTLRSYVTGLILALVLTAVPFWTIMSGQVSGTSAAVTLAIFALGQVVVHLVFFLHMNGSSAQRWNLMAFLFAVLIVVILVGGSLWIMHHLNDNMMAMGMLDPAALFPRSLC
jgi:cytochrome o ubiquinol oxidase subunit IV